MEGLINDLLSDRRFFLMREAGCAYGMRNGDGLYDAIGSYGLRDGYDCAYLHGGNPGPFYLLFKRCSATGARASGGRQNHGFDVFIGELLCNFRPVPHGVFQTCAVAGS